MAEGDPGTIIVRRRRSWGQRLAIEVATLLASLLLLAVAGLILIDTAPGHRFLTDRIARIETATGLRSSVGRIEGSIFGVSHLKNVRVADAQGVFLTSPDILLDWAPGGWLYNSLHIDRLEAETVKLDRLPRLKPSGGEGRMSPAGVRSRSRGAGSPAGSWRSRSALPRSGRPRKGSGFRSTARPMAL